MEQRRASACRQSFAALQVCIRHGRELDEGVHTGEEFEAEDKDAGTEQFGDELDKRVHGREDLGKKRNNASEQQSRWWSREKEPETHREDKSVAKKVGGRRRRPSGRGRRRAMRGWQRPNQSTMETRTA
jgi:hypothetical protein